MVIPVPRPVFRFAPSPNGYLHVGHAYSALLNEALAKRSRGRLLLRLEDIDQQRCRAGFVEAIGEDLGWLGLAWERPVLRQSAHFDRYAAAIAQLDARGLTYPCFCSRLEIAGAVSGRGAGWPRDPENVPHYPGTCRSLSPAIRQRRLARGDPHTIRLDAGRAYAAAGGDPGWVEHDVGSLAAVGRQSRVRLADWGDVVLVRRDTPTSYHLAVVVDDAYQQVTHVVRGRDLYAATAVHVMLQRLLGYPAPAYVHHDLLVDEAGEKLAKSRGAPSLRSLRAAGVSARELRLRFGFEPGGALSAAEAPAIPRTCS